MALPLNKDMPFKSEKQRRFMWARYPKIARRWAEEMEQDMRQLHKKHKKMRLV